MCSVVEEDFGDEGGAHTMLKDVILDEIEEENCKKCSVEKSVVKLDFKEPMCLSCFLFYVRHKFRAALGSSKIVKRQSSVLLHFSGNSADVCLLHMINFAFLEESYKRLCFDLKIVFIDESCTTGINAGINVMEFRLKKVQEIKEIMQQFPNFTCHYSTIADNSMIIEDITTISCTEMETIVKSEEEFSSFYNSIESLTSKQDFLDNMRNNAIRDSANHLKCSYVFVADLSINLAKRLISNIALGRGFSVANDVSFCDDRISSMKIIRPLKDVNQMEVDNYVKFNNLKTCSFPTNSVDEQLASVQNLTSNFIDKLQQNSYNSTVSTVYKCCSKIAPNDRIVPSHDNSINSKLTRSYITDMNQRCLFCKSNLDYHHSETLYAIEFSRCVSSKMTSEIDKMESLQNIRETSVAAKNGNENDRNKYLCHGCRNIFSRIKDENSSKLF